MQAHQKKHVDIDAPMSLGGLFSDDGDSDDNYESSGFEQIYEVQDISISDMTLKIRQYSWHQANANKGISIINDCL